MLCTLFFLFVVMVSPLFSAENQFENPEIAEAWNAVTEQESGWLGADGIYSVTEPKSGDVYVHFSDTICGTTRNSGRDYGDVYMVNHTFWRVPDFEPPMDVEQAGKVEFFVPLRGKNLLPDRYWLQDGIILRDEFQKLFLHTTGMIPDSAWKPTRVDWVAIPILDGGKLDFQNAKIERNTPILAKTERGPIIFGAAFLEEAEYVYIFGYRDAVREFSRKDMVLARVEADRLTDFSAWRFWAGDETGKNGWSENIQDCVPLVRGISCEFSVSRIPTGPAAGKFLLVYTRGGISPEIAYRTASTPEGPYGEEFVFCRVPEHADGISAYNAKGHPALSSPGKLVISANLNRLGHLPRQPKEYRPRFWTLDYEGIEK